MACTYPIRPPSAFWISSPRSTFPGVPPNRVGRPVREGAGATSVIGIHVTASSSPLPDRHEFELGSWRMSLEGAGGCERAMEIAGVTFQSIN